MKKHQGIYRVVCVQAHKDKHGNRSHYRVGVTHHHIESLSTRMKDHVVIMHEKTAQSLGEKFPLENRINIVVTKKPGKYDGLQDVFDLTCPKRALKSAIDAYPDKDIYLLDVGRGFKPSLQKYCSKLLMIKAQGNQPLGILFTVHNCFRFVGDERFNPHYNVAEYENHELVRM